MCCVQMVCDCFARIFLLTVVISRSSLSLEHLFLATIQLQPICHVLLSYQLYLAISLGDVDVPIEVR